MNIIADISCVVIFTKTKMVRHRRKDFKRNGKTIKVKTFLKPKKIPLRKPYLQIDVKLKVNELLVLGGTYIDNNDEQYKCTERSEFSEPNSFLRIMSVRPIGNKYQTPKSLTLIS